MSLHIEAKKGEIAEKVLISGDPLRAQYMAEEFLQDLKCYNQVRGMNGYTGLYKGEPVSIQGTGMGMPSTAIYVHELIHDYGVKEIIRMGTCGIYQKEVAIGDVILAQGACTDSSMNKNALRGMDYAAIADFSLLYAAYNQAQKLQITCHVGNILTADVFYDQDPEYWKLWASYGVLGVEMESNVLYSLCARKRVKALALFTATDCFITGARLGSKEREKGLKEMVSIALESNLT